jgi:hypothetical protein
LRPAEARFKLLQMLNRGLEKTIPFVDLCMADKTWSIARLLAACRGLIFRAIKRPLWDLALQVHSLALSLPFTHYTSRRRPVPVDNSTCGFRAPGTRSVHNSNKVLIPR